MKILKLLLLSLCISFQSYGYGGYYKTKAVKVYPVPTPYILYIKSQEDIKELKVFSTTGQEVYVERFKEKISEKILDVSNYPRGMYIVKITTVQKDIYAKVIVVI